MDSLKEPGIKILKIILVKSIFKRQPNVSHDFKNIINFSVAQKFDEKDSKKILITELDVTINKEDDPVYMELKYIGVFSESIEVKNMTLKEFAKSSSAAMLIPYAREEIQNRMLKAGLSDFAILPPLNIHMMTEAHKDNLK